MDSMRLCGRSAAALMAGLVLSTCATNPVTGKKELSFVSESQEIQMGKENSVAVKQQMGVYPDSAVQRYVNSIGQELAHASERPDLPWEYTVIDDPVVNAFALPGGFIFMTRGILTYMNSEAEMATVIGHETGHVTARHSVQQMTQEQLAQVGLLAGAIASKQVASHLGELTAGLGVLFLKYSRDHEAQADELGFKYALNDRYDVREMANMFRTLQRVGGGGKIPEWQSTHPDPGNRIQAVQQRLAKVTLPANLKVNRDKYLSIIDGMTFGEDPRKGFFQGSTFLHPGLAFALDFPNGWATQNTDAAVGAISPKKDAILELSSAGTASPNDALQKFLSQDGVKAGQVSSASINGNPAATAVFGATTDNGELQGVATFISYNGVTFQFLGYGNAADFANNSPIFRKSMGSFRKVTDPAVLNLEPARLQIVQVPSAMTLEQYYQKNPSSVPLETIAIINGMEKNTPLVAGQKIKRVVGGVLPGN